MASSKLQLPADDSVLLLITHSNLSTFAADIRVSQQTTVEALKDKLWRKTGTAVASMRLQLRDDSGTKIADLDDDTAPLAAYAPYNSYRIHVVDLDPSSLTSGGWLEDTSLVDKYKMSDETYDKLDTNFRKFKEKIVPKNSPSEDKEESEKHMEELCSKIKVGDRCEVEPGAKRGTVKFVGRAEALGRGFWVGVQYDEPLGKHDGMVKGIRFFECPQGHVAIVRPEKVKVLHSQLFTLCVLT
ncbi:Tubulin-folding cofactor B [Zea mays]|uniref:Tubulin-folding cofactor B n=1 Tax=Zea mays TaxID=4577 RepID=A0A3L6FW12_MAIZE|nr:Tubulin-folding cofactor B [Zea mays]